MRALLKASNVTRSAFAQEWRAQVVLEWRFGALEHRALRALNQVQPALLEELVLENTWSQEQVRARLG